jgi:hypothetical protein
LVRNLVNADMSQESQTFTLTYPDGRELAVRIVVSGELGFDHSVGALRDADVPSMIEMTLSRARVEDHECDEPDKYLTEIVGMVFHIAPDIAPEQRSSLYDQIHEWLCERRSDASLRDHDD